MKTEQESFEKSINISVTQLNDNIIIVIAIIAVVLVKIKPWSF